MALKRINLEAAHKRLWIWLASNPGKWKWQWPEWEDNGGNIPYSIHHCLACKASHPGRCPVDCVIGGCQPDFTLWNERNAIIAEVGIDHVGADTLALCKESAMNLALATWKGPKMFYI